MNRPFLIAAAVLAAASTAWAVHPQAWTQQTEDDYAEGTFDNTVVNSFGELTLGRQTKPLITRPRDGQALDFINAFAQTKDGTVYFSTSPAGKVYKIADGQPVPVYSPPEESSQILALATDAKGNLLIATSGTKAALVRLAPGADAKPDTVFEDADVKYIWAVKADANGTLYLATGPNGAIYKVSPEGKASQLAVTKEKNVLALAFGPKGELYAATDGEGLVLRVDKQTGKPFVMLDAGPVDVSSLATDEAGNVYAATAGANHNDAETSASPTESTDNSKPAKPETDKDDPNNTNEPVQPKGKDDPGARAPWSFPPGFNPIYADAMPKIPADLQALINKAKARLRDKKSHESKVTTKHSEADNSSKSKESTGSESDSSDLNKLYKIAPTGETETLFTEPDMLLSLLYTNHQLLVGSGGHGKLFTLDPNSRAKTLAARVHNQNVLALFAGADGTVYLGTANTGQVYTLAPSLADTGTYTSKVYDASHAADFGSELVEGDFPEGSTVTLATRTGNTADVDKNPDFWSDWSADAPVTPGTPIKPAGEAGRYLQYRVTLHAKGQTGPVIDQVQVNYQVRNLPPVLNNLQASVDLPSAAGSSSSDSANNSDTENTATPAAPKTVHVTWEASDPNDDTLTYRLYDRQVGASPALWVLLAKDLKDQNYTWDTSTVPDGKYQLKVVATDAADNPGDSARSVARTTGPIAISNTPPSLKDLKATPNNDKTVTLTGQATSPGATIADVRYQIDGQGAWQPAAAADKMFDSPTEAFTATTRALAAGGHRMTVRATDRYGNASYQAVTFSLPG